MAVDPALAAPPTGGTNVRISPLPPPLPFDQYQRYAIAREVTLAVEAALPAGGRLRVLDVGGHYEGPGGEHRRPICDVLPGMPTVTVDLGIYRLAGYAAARGDALPFADGAFDVVACLDVIEHVEARERPGVLAELMRVARRVVVIAAPFFDARVVGAEGLLAEFVERTWGAPQAQLAEHRERGWPDLPATVGAFERAGWTARPFAHGNLWRWLFMMIDKLAVARLPHAERIHARLDVRYNELDFARDVDPPCYRQFIVAWRAADDPARAAIDERFVSPSQRRGASPSSVVTPADAAMLDLAGLHARNQALVVEGEPARHDAHLAASEAHRAELYRHLAAKDEYIAKLERLLRSVERSATYRVTRLLRRVFPRAARSDPEARDRG